MTIVRTKRAGDEGTTERVENHDICITEGKGQKTKTDIVKNKVCMYLNKQIACSVCHEYMLCGNTNMFTSRHFFLSSSFSDETTMKHWLRN